MAAPQRNSDLPTRVTVLEHGVSELKSNLESHRAEARSAFASITSALDARTGSIQGALDRLIDKGAGQRTNWYLVAGFVVSIVTVVSAMVAVAEWRIGQATAPFQSVPEQVTKLRIDIEKERAAIKAVEEFKRQRNIQ
jgi:uncharacterized protein YceH (UPF0502 family)